MTTGKAKKSKSSITKPKKSTVKKAVSSVDRKNQGSSTPSSSSTPPDSLSSDGDDSPAFLIIPILSEMIGQNNAMGTSGLKTNEISIEDARDYPIGMLPGKRRPNLKLPTSILKKKSPLTLKLDKAKEELEKYNSESLMDDIKKHPIKDQILLMDIDVSIKSTIIKKFEDNEKSKNGYDQSKFMNWVKDVVQLPFSKSIPLPITMQDGPKKIHTYLEKVRGHLNTAIAGQESAKEEVVDFIARLISNPKSRGNIIAFAGAKGVGKTKLVRKGVAEALGRPFHVINLGGMNDVHVLTGHDLTYTGAKYGRFAQIMIQSKCENPVIYLDEIDKVQSGSDKGMEIFRVLTHVLDEEQNHEFFDEYFAGIKIDLSKILFVASLNNPDDIEPVLRDRLKIIHVENLDLKTKLQIIKNYMLPELCTEVAFPLEQLHITEDIMKYIIRTKTEEEDGCRQLKRNLETIIQKLNTQRITSSGYFAFDFTELNEDDSKPSDKVVNLTESLVDILLKKTEDKNKIPSHIYC